jgi:trk system potassium uptake protein TrkH
MLKEGLPLITSIFHSIWIFMAGWDTGGFAPHSQNILYYHSLALEIAIIFIIILGSFNFKLHYAIWAGNRKEIWRNIELVVFFLAIVGTFAITGIGLAQNGLYPEIINMFRKGFFQLISGHTGTGYMTIYARQFILEWGHLALFGVIIAMGIGGCICSTTGAIKTLRIGIIFKALHQDIRQLLLPESAVLAEKFQHLKAVFLTDKMVRSAVTITLLYILLYIFGSLIGMFYGYSFIESTFESVSAAANVGLSCGITVPTMPAVLKITYIFQMWIGRLEFMAVFALIAFIVSCFRGK